MTNKKILIVGNSAGVYALAKKLSETEEVYVTSTSTVYKDFATTVDIRDTNSKELLEFVMENDISMTIVMSKNAIKNDIVTIFNSNNQPAFGPSSSSAEIALNKPFAKKLMYKLRIPTPKFGIFDKENSAIDYIKNQKIPFVIKTNDSKSATIITSQNSATRIISSCFYDKNTKLIIEDYIYGTPFTYYAVTDGYKALPLGSSITYKHSLEGNGGQLTTGMGACSPNYKLSSEQEYFLMDNVIYPTLEYLEAGKNPYIGIIGINGIISDDGNIKILGYVPFLQDCDAANIINLVDDDWLRLFEACIISSFSDEYESINQSNSYAVSVTIHSTASENKTNIISGTDTLSDNILTTFYPNVNLNKYMEYEASPEAVITLTAMAPTPSRASKYVYNDIKNISFDGIKYRKDICNNFNQLVNY